MSYESIMESMEGYCRKAAQRWLDEHHVRITEETFEDALQAARVGVWKRAQEVEAKSTEDLFRNGSPYWKVFSEIFDAVIREGCAFGGVKYPERLSAVERPKVLSAEQTRQDAFTVEWSGAELSRIDIEIFSEILTGRDRIILQKLMQGYRVSDILIQTGITRAEYTTTRLRIGRAWRRYQN